MNIDHLLARERSEFKIVCSDCGNLSIRITDPANSPVTTLIECARCSAVRGTVGSLQELARRGVDLFEF
jgi:hypothetical protein